jgi:hypothetical protein
LRNGGHTEICLLNFTFFFQSIVANLEQLCSRVDLARDLEGDRSPKDNASGNKLGSLSNLLGDWCSEGDRSGLELGSWTSELETSSSELESWTSELETSSSELESLTSELKS